MEPAPTLALESVPSGDVAVLVQADVADRPGPAHPVPSTLQAPDLTALPAAAPGTAGGPAADHPRVLFRAGAGDSWVKLLMSPALHRRITDNRTMEVAFLLGIAAVFLVNAAVAVVSPAGFVELVAHSPAGALLQTPAGPMIPGLIAVNDFLIGTAVLAVLKLRALRGPVLARAGAWLMLVTFLKLFAL